MRFTITIESNNDAFVNDGMRGRWQTQEILKGIITYLNEPTNGTFQLYDIQGNKVGIATFEPSDVD